MDRYKSISEDSKGKTSAQNLTDFALSQELAHIQQYSLACDIFVSEGMLNSIKEEYPNYVQLINNYMYVSSDDTYIDSSRIASLSEIDTKDVTWVDGEKTKLADNEIIIDINALSKNDEENKVEAILKKPNFLVEKTNLTPAEKGTIMHLCLQKLNSKEKYNLNKLKKLVNSLVEKEIILPKEAESVNYNKILAFLESNIWKEMQDAKTVEQEKAFYLNLKAKEIYKNSAEDEVLVQGIIDLYYITNNDELVLVDYKTDYVENNNEESLKEKYNVQLSIYKKALEEALKRKVDRVYIYSTWLNKEIKI